jgi:hypothetical protein
MIRNMSLVLLGEQLVPSPGLHVGTILELHTILFSHAFI